MANEATLTLALAFAKGTVPSQSINVSALARNVAGGNYVRNVQTVGFAAREALLLGDVGTPGLCVLHNCDATNPVEIFPDGTDLGLIKLLPGDYALVRFSTATPFAQATTAAVALEYLLLPN